MRLQLYVPQRQANVWDPRIGFISWQEFQKRVVRAAGGVYVSSATGRWGGDASEPVYVVEALIPSTRKDSVIAGHAGYQAAYETTWATFREYAHQLLAHGEESVLIVQDSEPTLIRH